jgi:hypothetical protein
MTATATTSTTRTAARGRRAGTRRRGSIYAVVLAMAILVSLIGLSAVAVGRINLRSAAGGREAAAAELLALSAVEHAVAVLNTDAAWRGNAAYLYEQTTTPTPLGDGTFRWKLRDELDGDIRSTVGGIQPVRVFGIGEVGDARRQYSVVLVPTGNNLLSNSNLEGGTTPFAADGTCTVAATATDVRNGVRSLLTSSRVSKDAGPRQDVTAKINDGKWYYAEAWVKMSTSEDVPVIALVVRKGGADLTVLTAAALPVQPGQDPNKVGLDWKRVYFAIRAQLPSGYDAIYWRITTANTAQDFRVDDVKLIEQTSSGTAMPMAPARETWKQEDFN